MKKYRVTIHSNMEQLLEEIRNRTNPEYTRWPTQDFYCRRSAEVYAFQASLATGRTCTIKAIDPNQYRSLRDRIEHQWGLK